MQPLPVRRDPQTHPPMVVENGFTNLHHIKQARTRRVTVNVNILVVHSLSHGPLQWEMTQMTTTPRTVTTVLSLLGEYMVLNPHHH